MDYYNHDQASSKLNAYLELLNKTFGPKANIAFAYFLATCYRDVIADKQQSFPNLIGVGAKASGKSFLGRMIK